MTNAGPLFATKKGKPVDVPQALAPLADTHGHLTAFKKTEPKDAVVRAALAGVRLLVVPVDPADDVEDVSAFLEWFERVRQEAAEELATMDMGPEEGPRAASLTDNLYFVAGVHPYGAVRFMEDETVRSRLERLLSCDACLGVGEFGLDLGPWNEISLDRQIPAFEAQLRIAHERCMPVELHLRDGEGPLATAAHDCALQVLREVKVSEKGCDLHCFTSGPEIMKPFTQIGCHIAFGGAATFGRSDDIRSAIVECPQELLLCETDSPYMAPVPLRGQECEPAMVAFNAHNIASVRAEAGVAQRAQTYAALWENACDFFGHGSLA